jgi:hypothetical protein
MRVAHVFLRLPALAHSRSVFRPPRQSRIPPVDSFQRSRMLMPLLVRLTDSEIEATDFVGAQALNAVEDSVGVVEKVSSAGGATPGSQAPLR